MLWLSVVSEIDNQLQSDGFISFLKFPIYKYFYILVKNYLNWCQVQNKQLDITNLSE